MDFQMSVVDYKIIAGWAIFEGEKDKAIIKNFK
jgi:hypothetical protein